MIAVTEQAFHDIASLANIAVVSDEDGRAVLRILDGYYAGSLAEIVDYLNVVMTNVQLGRVSDERVLNA